MWKNHFMTYRELLIILRNLPSEELNNNVVVADVDKEEYLPVRCTDFTEKGDAALDEGHLVILI